MTGDFEMDWLNEIPANVKDGYLMLKPENREAKSVEEVTPAFKEGAEYMIKNKFPGVLN
jgi:hypothetical protein